MLKIASRFGTKVNRSTLGIPALFTQDLPPLHPPAVLPEYPLLSRLPLPREPGQISKSLLELPHG